MTITLKEGAPEQLDCKTYPLSGKELQVLRKALDDNVKKGYIKTWHFVICLSNLLHPKKRWRRTLHGH
jgi:hypothetical protein